MKYHSFEPQLIALCRALKAATSAQLAFQGSSQKASVTSRSFIIQMPQSLTGGEPLTDTVIGSGASNGVCICRPTVDSRNLRVKHTKAYYISMCVESLQTPDSQDICFLVNVNPKQAISGVYICINIIFVCLLPFSSFHTVILAQLDHCSNDVSREIITENTVQPEMLVVFIMFNVRDKHNSARC